MTTATPASLPPAPCDFALCLEQVRSGDQRAAQELVRRVQPMVLRIIRAHLPRRDAPEDLAQEVFLKLFSRLGQYRGGASFRRWLSQVTLRVCYDRLRAQRCRPELRQADLSENECAALEGRATDDDRREPADRLATRELLDLLLSRLPPEDRAVVVLFNLEQKTIADISLSLGWSRELVKMRVFRARRKLQRLLTNLPRWDVPLHARVASRGARRPRESRHRTPTTEAGSPTAIVAERKAA